MSVAALEALTLARLLSTERLPTSQDLMRELARIVDVPWQMAGAVDRAFLPSDKRQALRDRFMAAYVDRVQAAAEHDVVVGRAFLRVTGLVDPSRALMRPGLLWRALRVPLAAHAGSPGERSSAPTTSALGLDSSWSP
jgi:hypothetical protein